MQIIKNKKVWFFLLLGIMIITTFCIWRSGVDETKVYANGRVVERQNPAESYLAETWIQQANEKSEAA